MSLAHTCHCQREVVSIRAHATSVLKQMLAAAPEGLLTGRVSYTRARKFAQATQSKDVLKRLELLQSVLVHRKIVNVVLMP
jgi:hypothetical protein